MILFPSCSEYVTRLDLTPEELIQAKEMAKKFDLSKEELVWLNDYLEKGVEKDYTGRYIKEFTGPQFMEEGPATPYIEITNTILEQRKNNKLKNGTTN